MRGVLELILGIAGLGITLGSILMASVPLGIVGVVITALGVGMRLNS
jgi:hypothetical protein